MKKPYLLLIPVVAVILIGGGVVFTAKSVFKHTAPLPTPTPTDEPIMQLAPDQAPQVALDFSADGHYVTVNITSIHAAALEYNLIYDALVKGTKINTGVNAAEKLNGQTVYSKQQLLGSESSGHFTYHTNIANATMELTLRDAAGHSVYDVTYPFTVTPGKSQTLQPQQ